MEFIIRLCAIALCAAVFGVYLRQHSPVFAVILSLLAGILILVPALDAVGQVWDSVSRLMSAAKIEGEVYVPVIKAVGIAIVVRVASEICRDAGESSVGSKLEIAGVAAAIAVCLPLMEQVIRLIGGFL